jgi:hypothetical protein
MLGNRIYALLRIYEDEDKAIVQSSYAPECTVESLTTPRLSIMQRRTDGKPCCSP